MSIDWSAVDHQDQLRTRIERIVPIFDADEPFTADDLGLDHPQILKYLAEANCLRVVDRDETSDGDYRNTYEWRPDARAALRDYWEQLPKLPCGCHAHIPAGDGDTPEGTLACNYCGDVHDKDVYREAL